MKNQIFLFFSVAIILLSSCSKEDKLGNLPGTWLLNKVTVDDEASTGTGSLTFNEEIGTMSLSFVVENTTVSYEGTFSYTETEDEVTLQGGPGNTIILKRVTNTSKKQVFELTQFIDVKSYSVSLEFGK
jgi:hypothetical protein